MPPKNQTGIELRFKNSFVVGNFWAPPAARVTHKRGDSMVARRRNRILVPYAIWYGMIRYDTYSCFHSNTGEELSVHEGRMMQHHSNLCGALCNLGVSWHHNNETLESKYSLGWFGLWSLVHLGFLGPWSITKVFWNVNKSLSLAWGGFCLWSLVSGPPWVFGSLVYHRSALERV